MQSIGSGRIWRAPQSMSRVRLVAVALAALTLAACNQNGPTAAMPRGLTVAFESIDGLPPGQFRQLVQHLNEEAENRRLAIMSRGSQSAYRLRGYLAAHVARKQTTVVWVWDVFDGNEQRALRITGEEIAKGRRRDAWSAADDEMLQRIARNSMEQLTAFLTSAEVAPGTPDTAPATAAAATPDSAPSQPDTAAALAADNTLTLAAVQH